MIHQDCGSASVESIEHRLRNRLGARCSRDQESRDLGCSVLFSG
jgi:hypothetical protein